MSDPDTPPYRRPKISSGIPELDSILHGGLGRNRVYLIEGLPGTGKTTLAMQFLLEGARWGENGVLISLSHTADDLRTIAESHGWSLDNVLIYELPQTGGQSPDETQQTFYRPSDVELTEIIQPVVQMLKREKPTRLVFDSISEIRLLAGDPLRYRREILRLKRHFAEQDCTALLVDDLLEIQGDVQLQSLVHGVLRLERLPMQYGSLRRRLSILKMRGATFQCGYHDFRIRTGGLRVFPRLVAAEHGAEGVAGLASSGIPELDELLGGGVERGSSVLVTGPAGVGKSVLTTQFIHAAAKRGERSLICLFDETRKRLLDRTDSLHLNVRQHVEDGRIHIRQIDPAELSPGELVQLVREAVENDGVGHVRFDSLDGYIHALPEERFLVLQLHELLTYLAHKGVVTYLVSTQRGVLGERPSTAMSASVLVDTTILLRYFENAGAIRRVLAVLKKRSGSHEEMLHEFTIGRDGFHFGPTLQGFRGILTGTPVYVGNESHCARESADAPY